MSKKTKKEKQFTDFLKFMKYLKGVKFSENASAFFGADAEEHNGFLAVSAHSGTVELAKEYAKKIKGQVITYCIEDGDEGTSFTYDTGIRLVNREYFLFCKSKESAFCEEFEEYSDEQLEAMHE
jgi:nucleoid-associated protein YejK